MSSVLAKDFAHLHVHSEYSLLDGFSRIKKLVQQTKATGMSHLALTDHGAMYGAIEFYKACRADGINPVIGVEAYLTQEMSDHTKRYGDDYHHLLLLAKNTAGYNNLMRLTTIAHTEGWHLRPRIDKNALAQHAEGLIVTSSCLSGEIPKLLLQGQQEEAYRTARWYREVFGSEDFYLEIQDHHGVFDDGQPSPQGRLNKLLYQMHKQMHIPLVATNDLHYVEPGDHSSHDVLLCVQTGQHIHDKKRKMRFDSQEYYLKSPEEMYEIFPDLPDALANSVRIAERCSVDPLAYKARLPDYTVPAGYGSQNEFLYALCLQGVRERYGELTDPIKRRLDYEFNMIADKGFVPYFLIEWDFVNYARSHGIRCSARGSAAGSILAYTLGITNVDPLLMQLPFERFFNPERTDMPDIDMDFPDDRREEVIDYVAQKYGKDCVAQMVTFNTMAAKGAVRDTARVMDAKDLGDRITRLIPSGPHVTLQGSIESERALSALYAENGQARALLDQAMKLEGAVRSTGVHAAGVIVANESLEKFVPLQLRDTKDSSKGRITQYEQAHLEELGLIKFDFLGLANLTIIDNALKLIKQSRHEEIDLENVPMVPIESDEEQNARLQRSFDLLSSGETTGIFQLEGQKMREYIKQLKPSRLEDLMAMIALYRPGPMDSIPDFIAAKHGRKKVVYLHPRLAEWLESSYGIIVFQDQVLYIAVNMAGFSWGKVNKFRKALSKKKMDEVEGYKVDFIEGCVANGMKQEEAEELFKLILPFGGYGFNKAHAASYAVVAFYTAYLKANYTAEFMAAMLTTESQNAKANKKVPLAVAECKRMGVPILPPDVNRSQRDFSVENGAVRFGLLGIRGVGSKLVEEIIRERCDRGRYTTLANFCERLPDLTKGVIEVLVKVGALDSLGTRHQLLASIQDALSLGKSARLEKERGEVSLFPEVDAALGFALREAKPLAKSTVLEWEKEHLLTYVSGHPLDAYEVELAAQCTHTTATASEESNRQRVTLGGMIIEARRMTTKTGKKMIVAKLEDLVGTIEVLSFSNTLLDDRDDAWTEGQVVVVKGEVKSDSTNDQDNDEVRITCRNVEVLHVPEAGERNAYSVSFIIRVTGCDRRARSNDIIRVNKLFALLSAHPGLDTFEIVLDDVQVGEETCLVTLTPDTNTVAYSPALHQEVTRLLGSSSVKVALSTNRSVRAAS